MAAYIAAGLYICGLMRYQSGLGGADDHVTGDTPSLCVVEYSALKT